jgi:murein DD-endopeptidase MepM/ murein hydrolase activator NlpD
VGPPRGQPSPTPAASADPGVTPAPGSTPAPAGPRPRGAAPRSAAEFDLDRQVIDIAFPLQPTTRYRYRDNWGQLRPGKPETYNHLHSRRNGEARRAHDGIDIYARAGSPIVAPFAGTVVDPATRWQPWRRERYGRTVVIVSSEPRSEGYAAVLAHLERVFVAPGTVVRRGEVVGLAGNTGNAESSRTHLHFELRAPFLLAWPELGAERQVDAFNPYPSLLRADPKRD